MTRVPENVELMVVRSGDCHVPCAGPPRRAIGAEAGGLPKVVEHRLHRNSKTGALWFLPPLWVSSHVVLV